MIASHAQAELTVIMVSWNTRELTLRALATLFENAGKVRMQVVVWDNGSTDGSAQAIANEFPQVEVVANDRNIGFAAANNAVAASVRTEWLLLLNPDTETHSNAVKNLLDFAKRHPDAGIVGGRTVFPDGSLNPASCWQKPTLWSLFCSAVGLTRLFSGSPLFNAEGIGGWKRDSVRDVDIVVGCFFLLRRALWEQLEGFDSKYFMYGEEADMCLRAARLGYQPKITPDAQIMHLVGASTKRRSSKQIKLMQAKTTLMQDHWRPALVPIGRGLLWLWIANRRAVSWALCSFGQRCAAAEEWKKVWDARHQWLSGY